MIRGVEWKDDMRGNGYGSAVSHIRDGCEFRARADG